MHFIIDVDVNLVRGTLQHCYSKAPLFHYKTLLAHNSSGLSRVTIGQDIFLQNQVQNVFWLILILLCLPETSVDFPWKVLLTEAKTQFGVQKCKVRELWKSHEIKQDAYRKIRVILV